MRIALLLAVVAVAGCAGGRTPDSACEVFVPPVAADPSVQDGQTPGVRSTADPELPVVEDFDC
ncbi:hypothetical protein [Stutzerimonas tarimensis]|uniref:Secreted protein n=1 Tax=Stutzerimonas tarimensis TaxID=1507735 RepID=A0ABV7T795_9GAMM